MVFHGEERSWGDLCLMKAHWRKAGDQGDGSFSLAELQEELVFCGRRNVCLSPLGFGIDGESGRAGEFPPSGFLIPF